MAAMNVFILSWLLNLFVSMFFQENGRIVKTGDISIAKTLEKEGYKAISAS